MVYPSQRAPGPASLILLLPTPLPTLHSGHSGFGVPLALEYTKLTPTSGPLQVPFPVERSPPGLCKPDTHPPSLSSNVTSSKQVSCPPPSPRHSLPHLGVIFLADIIIYLIFLANIH